jgi:aminopeptidase-like protein
MIDWINELWFLKRDIVSDDFDRALRRLAESLPMTIHEYPTGQACWTWRIPEKWTCEEAYLETLDGRRLLSYADHPLHVVSYSLPFEGVVSREELLAHLHVHPALPEAAPFVFKYYERDWGLCASQRLRDSLDEPRYRVVIRTRFEPGTLKVGEVVIPGESPQTFVLAAHLCHPAMVNDDLTGVVVGLEVARALLARPRLYFSYRLLILPETIGSLAYLSHHEPLIPSMAGGLFLEMLGNASPHALQGSFQPHSQADRCLASALPGLDPQGYHGAYRSVIGNDERQFNAPGVRVPMLSLSRVEPPGSPTRPYREYHSSLDTPQIVSQARLEASRDVVLGLLDAWEKNCYPVNLFKGEVFASGYGIWIDYRVNPEGHRVLFRVMEYCDGEHSLADIAAELGASFQAVWGVVALLESKGLVRLSRTPQPTDPHRFAPGAG